MPDDNRGRSILSMSLAIQGFLLDMQAGGRSQGTVRLHGMCLNHLVGFLHDPELAAVKPDDLKRFFVHLRCEYKPKRPGGDVRPLSDSAIDNHWKAARSFFKWAEEVLKISRPDLTLQRTGFQDPVMIPFTHEEVERLTRACATSRPYSNPGQTEKVYTTKRPTANRDQAVILVLLDTGLRVGELVRLTIGAVDLQTGQIEVIPHGSGQKTKPRVVYLGKSARRALWRYLAVRDTTNPNDPLFLTDEERPMGENTIRHLLRNLGERAGVKGVHPHRFRHTFAIEFLRNSGDVYSLQRLLGHSTLTMCLRYLALAQADIGAAHRRASPADNWRL